MHHRKQRVVSQRNASSEHSARACKGRNPSIPDLGLVSMEDSWHVLVVMYHRIFFLICLPLHPSLCHEAAYTSQKAS